MNHKEEVPDYLGGLGDMLPADVLKKVNELLEQLHRKDKNHQGSTVFIYAPGSQYVDTQINIGGSPPNTLPLGRRVLANSGTQERARGVDSSEASKSLPEVLATDGAMVLWQKAQRAGRSEERRVGKECRSRWSPYH